jgi:hypothetical protein
MCDENAYVQGAKLCDCRADTTCSVIFENVGVSPATVELLVSQGLNWDLLELTSFNELVEIGVSEDDAILLQPDLRAKYFALKEVVRESGVSTSVQNIISQAKVHDVAGLRVLLQQSNAALRELGLTLGQVKRLQRQLLVEAEVKDEL